MEPAFARLIQEHEDRIPLRHPRGFAHQEVHQQAVAVLHQRMGHEHQPGLLPLALPKESRLPVRRALVRGVGAPVPMKVHRGVAPVAVIWGRIGASRLEALEARSRLDQRAVHGEVRVRQQASPVHRQDHLVEQLLAYLAPSSRCRFFVNTVASKLRSISCMPKNQRNSRL